MQLLTYRADNGWGASCGVTLWDAGPGVTMLVLTELPDHHGPSITNNIERAAELVVRLAGIDPRRTVCVEHYARVPLVGPVPLPKPAGFGETFDLVRFHVGSDRDGRPRLSGPKWSPLRTPEQWATLRDACVGGEGGGWALGVGPPPVRVPPALSGRIDGIYPRDLNAAAQSAFARRLAGGLGPATR